MKNFVFPLILTFLFACGDDMGYRQSGQPSIVVDRQGIRRKELVFNMVHCDAAGQSVNGLAWITNPSARLAGKIEAFYEPDGANVLIPSNQSNSIWTIFAAAPGVRKNFVNLNYVDPDTDAANPPDTVELPRAYEWSSAVQAIRVAYSLQRAQDSGAVAVDGTWYFRITWEPVVDISDQELNKLFSQCQVSFGS